MHRWREIERERRRRKMEEGERDESERAVVEGKINKRKNSGRQEGTSCIEERRRIMLVERE